MSYIYSDATIREILRNAKTIAIVGASPKDVRPSFFVARYMLDKNFRVFPVRIIAFFRSIPDRQEKPSSAKRFTQRSEKSPSRSTSSTFFAAPPKQRAWWMRR
jgi:hypothetical protein